LSVGDEVVAVGFSSGFRLRASVGRVKALYNYDGARVIRVSAAFTTGASGGGLFDRQGRLVGILSFKSTAGDDYHYAMPVEWLSQTNGIESDRAFWEREEQLQPFFLRGAWLEGTQDWAGLVNLAEQWTRAEPADVEAWISLARANGKLGRSHQARAASHRATLLDAQHAEVQRLQSSNESSLIGSQVGQSHSSNGSASTRTARDEFASRPR
jgi:serine protease Do